MFVVFPEIQCFGLGGDTLARIIAELPTSLGGEHHSSAGAKKLILVKHGAVGTVLAGALNLFSEQHGGYLSFIV